MRSPAIAAALLSSAALHHLAGSAHAGGIPASLLFSGNWSNPANWSTNPVVPNNGQPGATDTYNISIINRVATLDQNVTVTDLTLGHVSGGTNAIANTSTTPQTLNVEGAFNYAQGILGGNNTYIISPGGAMNFLATPVGQTKQLNAPLVNHGTVTINFLTNLQSTAPGTHLVNESGGTININNTTNLSRTAGSVDAALTNQPGATINVQSPANATINWIFNNHGTVNAESGSVTLNNGGTHTGAFNPGSGRTITFGGTGRTHTLSPASTVNGQGTVAFSTDAVIEVPPENFNPGTLGVNNGNVQFATAEQYESFIDALSMGGGRLDAGPGGRFDINAFMNWSGGELDTEVVIGPGAAMFATGTENPIAPRIARKTLTNNGFASLSGNLNNQTDAGAPAIVNNGTFKTDGTTNITGPGAFINSGIFETTTGTTTVSSPYSPQPGSTTRVKSGHALILEVIAELRGGFNVEDAAEINAVAANLEVMNAIAADIDAKGLVNFIDVANVVLDAATRLGGAGRVNISPSDQFEKLLVNLGITSPGNSPGTLTIGASFVLGDTSQLEFELGAPGSAQVDRIDVLNNLTLDGTLNVAPLDGFAPGMFTLITVAGAITDNGLTLGEFPPGFVGEVVIDQPNGEVQLVVTPAPPACPGDYDASGDVGLGDIALTVTHWAQPIGPGTPPDADADGFVGLAEIALIVNHWATICP